MPRNGSGVMSWPPNTQGVPGTTVSSTRYNAFLADLLQDLNTARPVTAGGTGGTSAVSGNDGLNTTGADMPSAATLNLANATGVIVNVTGTTTITALGTVSSGAMRTLVFAGILTLTHNATSLILPGAADIITGAGDVATFRSKGAGNWVCVDYQRSNGRPVSNTLDSPTINTPTLTLKQSAAAAPTVSGDIQLDTTTEALVIGDGAAASVFPKLPASVAAADLFYASGARTLARLAKGTAGQLLAMNSGASAPEWQADQRVGVGQTWQNVAGSRTHSTAYQNTTGKPIVVAVRYSASGGTRNFQVNNSAWIDITSAASGALGNATVVVPHGGYYWIDGPSTIWQWAELRA